MQPKLILDQSLPKKQFEEKCLAKIKLTQAVQTQESGLIIPAGTVGKIFYYLPSGELLACFGLFRMVMLPANCSFIKRVSQ